MVKEALLCKHPPVLWEETAGCQKVIKRNITYAARPQSREGIFPTAVRQIEVETQDEIFEILTPLVCLLAPPQNTLGVLVRSHNEREPLRIAELQQLDELLKANS